MRKILFALLLTCCIGANAQVYNNEWIDYTKTYYKFKIVKNGLYRISQTTLAAAGLGSTPAEHFKLWRNGQQVPIYTSVPSGTLSSADYIEFWGQMNDGKPDRELYKSPAYHLNDKWSLITDTAAYFLTVDASAKNKRLATTANNVASNTLPKEPFFLHTVGNYYRTKLNPGEAYNVGEFLYSSSYDKGEGWTSRDVTSRYSALNGYTIDTLSATFNNLFPFSGGPAPKFKIAASGNTFTTRRYRVRINSDSVIGAAVPYMSYSVDSTNFAASLLSSGSASVIISNIPECFNPPNCPTVDRMVVHKFELTYPREFNFGGASNFEFTLPASASGNYLEISGFNYGSVAPVLYDLTNGRRYVADISAAPLVKIVLQPSGTSKDLILVSNESDNITAVTTLQTRNFINYTSPENRGDYLIISHPNLFSGADNTNPVEEYRSYRSSVTGGSFNAKIYLSDELVDQFGLGIKKNPSGIRNFLRYARNVYPQKPKHVFLIGKGANYIEQRKTELGSSPELADRLNLIPTFGHPASDMLLTSQPGKSSGEIPIGRLSVINAAEVAVYLKKIKEYELAQKTFSPALKDRNWMKNIVHIIGASEVGLDAILSSYMQNYKQVIEDTL
ncbi:MAG TPA: C25 family cysteine peptidase, partial [Flavisolibacter sp.]|nr:C25 family cysteine peptidase [Flavisolibacter sp.]